MHAERENACRSLPGPQGTAARALQESWRPGVTGVPDHYFLNSSFLAKRSLCVSLSFSLSLCTSLLLHLSFTLS